MKLLALDAALGWFSVALDLEGAITADQSDRNDALEAGLSRIARLLESASVSLSELDRIAVGIGPGSFTGLRIALSFAKALAYGANIPLVGISSYDVLTPSGVPEPSLTVVAGRPGVICARLRTGQTVRVACGPPADVMNRLLGDAQLTGTLTVIAAREDVFPPVAEGAFDVKRLLSPMRNPAAVIARLAREREPAVSPHGVAPDYGELPAVTRPKARTENIL